MDEERNEQQETPVKPDVDVGAAIRSAIEEFARKERMKDEPAYKTELLDERKRREQLERRVNELVEENKRSRDKAEAAERNSAIRAELQRIGVAKVDLAFKAVKDDIVRSEDGRLTAVGEQGPTPMKDYLAQFVNENPEFLPARISGGSGATTTHKGSTSSGAKVDLDGIRPGMSRDDLERVRREIAQIASQALGSK